MLLVATKMSLRCGKSFVKHLLHTKQWPKVGSSWQGHLQTRVNSPRRSRKCSLLAQNQSAFVSIISASGTCLPICLIAPVTPLERFASLNRSQRPILIISTFVSVYGHLAADK